MDARLVLVGPQALRYHKACIEDGAIPVSLLSVAQVMDPAILAGKNVTAFAFSMYQDHGKELDVKDTKGGLRAGAALRKKLVERYPDAKFLIFGASAADKYLKEDSIVFLPPLIDIAPSDLVEIIRKHVFAVSS